MNLIKLFVNLFQFNRTNWRAVTLCFFAATVFWLFNAFNKSYSTNIWFPLRFEYSLDRYSPAIHLPDRVILNVSGNGWDLFRKSTGLRQTELVIPIERPTEVKKIVGSTLPVLFANQLGDLKINHVVTDTLYVAWDEHDRHTFSVLPDFSEVRFIEGYGQISTTVVLPDSVVLEGPKKLLHLLPGKLPVKLPRILLDNSYREELEIIIPHTEFITVTPSKIAIMFEVGPVEIVEKKIPVVALGRRITADSVIANFQIPRNLHEDFEIAVRQVEARVDVEGKQREAFKIVPFVVGLPPYAKVLDVDSIEVKQ